MQSFVKLSQLTFDFRSILRFEDRLLGVAVSSKGLMVVRKLPVLTFDPSLFQGTMASADFCRFMLSIRACIASN
jgi:hypothetical protein